MLLVRHPAFLAHHLWVLRIRCSSPEGVWKFKTGAQEKEQRWRSRVSMCCPDWHAAAALGWIEQRAF